MSGPKLEETLNNAVSTLGAETLQLGGTILLQSPVGAVYAFQMDPQNDQPKHISPKEARKSLARGVKAGLGESLENLVDQVDDADHRVWWGSSQFKEMQSALTKLSELAETLNEQPTPQQLKDLRKRLRALEDTSKAYLERKKLPAGCFVVGRHVMTCCVEDIQFAALVCQWDKADTVQDDTWMVLTAKIDFKFHRAYGRKGPVLSYISAEPCPAPEQPVATFY